MADVRFTAEYDDTALTAALAKQADGVEKLQDEFDTLGEKATAAMAEAGEATKATTNETAKIAPSIGAGTKATGIFAKGLKVLRGIIATLGLTALAAVAGTLVTAFLKAKPVADALSDAFAGMNRIITELVERAVQFGTGFAKILSGDIRGGVNDISGSFDNLQTSLIAAGAAGASLNRELRAISEQEADLALDIAQQAERLARLNAIRGDNTKSIRERQAALRESGATEREFAVRNISLLEKRLQIANSDAAATAKQRADAKGNIRLTEDQIALQIELGQAKGKLAELDIDAANDQRELRKEAREAALARRKELEELDKQAQAFLGQLEKLRTGQLSGIERVRAERAIALKAIDEQEAALRKVFQERGVQFNLEAEFEQARVLTAAKASKEIQSILLDEAKEREKIQERARALEERQTSEAQRERLKEIELGKEILLARTEFLEQGGKAEIDFAIEIARRKLQIEINAQRARLEVLSEQYGENSPEVQLAGEQIRLLEREYDKAGDIQLTGIEALKAKILSALGITEEEAGIILQQAGNAINSVVGLIGAGTEEQLAQNDKVIKSIKDRIGKTEGLLRDEQRRQEQGYANNAALFEESLKKQQSELAKAQAEREKLQEEATKKQVRQNQIQAGSEYALLVIKLLASQASKGIIGIGIALGGLALVAKIIADQKKAAAKLVTGFWRGTEYVEGPGTGKSDSVPAMVSRGERIMTADQNKAIGGKKVDNESLVRLALVGQQVEAGSFADANKATRRADSETKELKASIDLAVMERAYLDAAETAASRIISSIEAQPNVIPVGKVTIVEQMKDGVFHRDVLKHQE